MTVEERETKAGVSNRHREEWASFRREFLNPLSDTASSGYGSLEAAKFAKALADILKVYQEGERKAYGFAEGEVDTSLELSWDE